MTSPGAFTPAWDGVTGGAARSLVTTLNFASSTCSESWQDGGPATSLNLQDGFCYKWTFDESKNSAADKPNEEVSDKSSLTSGILKVSQFACRMESQWIGDQVVITYALPNVSSGIDCRAEFTTPKNVGKIDYLLVGGGGAGGWASTIQSQGGGGGGGGGTSFSQINASVTPGRTYAIQVGAGAIVGTRDDGDISCLRGEVGAITTTVNEYGGTSKLGKFIAEGGGCAEDTGGVERGSDGGISANGRTGGRGGSCYSRDCSTGSLSLPPTSFYTNGTFVNGLNAWEGAGGGGGASYSEDSNSPCNYGNSNWDFYTGCDGWDIAGVGAFGGIGGNGIQSWYQGVCNYYFGGGGGGGGSTSLTDSGYSYLGVTRSGLIQEYIWNVDRTEFANGVGHYFAKSWMPLGGRGGIGGGGQAATSTTNWSETPPNAPNYQPGQDGINGCGGGGGGGQANKVGAYRFTDINVLSYDVWGDPIFERDGFQFESARDGSNQRILFTHPTIPSWYGVYVYKEVGNPSNERYIDNGGYVYNFVMNDWLGAGYGESQSDPNSLGLVNSFGIPLAEIYQFDGHTYTISEPYILDSYEHAGSLYSEYLDENGNSVYLDESGSSFYVVNGYQNNDYYSQGTSVITAVPSAQTLDSPGKGGNGLVAIRFNLGVNYGSQFNPALKVPTSQKIWPNLSQVVIPIALKQTGGAGYVCINLVDPTNPSNLFEGSSTIRMRLGNTSGASLSESQLASQLREQLSRLSIGKSIEDYLIRDRDAWVSNRKLFIRVSYSGSDSIATNSCANSSTDLPVGGTPLIQYLTLERLSATQVRSFQVLPKNGRQNN
jgi:hypothetical protein